MSLVIALSGPMAAGKNQVADILQKNGYAVIDADITAHEALDNIQNKIIEVFSTDAEKMHVNLINENGSINRAALAQIVFSNPENLQLHESLIFPEITRLLEIFLSENKDKHCVINATVLHKTTLIDKCSFIIYVTAPLIIRLFRARRRDKASVFHILKRFSAQKNLYAQYRKKNVDIYKVYNFGSRKSLEKKVLKLLKKSCKY